MLEKIYTIPVNEAIDAVIQNPAEGCPFCRLYRKLENDETEIILGASMMEPDVRIKTNEQGFCGRHFDMMFERNNRLGLALILESHLAQVREACEPGGLFGMKTQKIPEKLGRLEKSCYVCGRIEHSFGKMVENTVYLYETESDFRKKMSALPYICLPHYLHVPVVEYAFLHKVNVLSEKPMSIKYEDAERAVKTAKENGVLYGVIFQSRYNDASVFVKKALDSGKLGKIKSASSVLTWSRSDDYYNGSDWKGTWDKEGGGVVIDQAIHSIDLVNTFINEKPKRISAGMAIRGHKGIKVEDTAEGLIEYESGIKYAFYCMNNYACDEPITIKLCCENGKAELSYTSAKITYKPQSRTSLDKEKLTEILGDDLKPFEKTTTYNVLRVK